LYDSILKVTGTTRIVDASKWGRYAHVLAQTPALDVRVLHLVRDVRGVAYSWGKQGVDRPNTGGTMPTAAAPRAAMAWLAENGLLAMLPRRIPRTVVRYEDLVIRGDTELREHLSRLGIDDVEVPAFAPNQPLALNDCHGISGNPMRFQRSAVTLRGDEAWRTEMSRRDAMAAMAISAPMLKRYGYLGRR